jgi:hypothetical protein
MIMIATALLIVASASLSTLAATITFAPQLNYSSMNSPDHDGCADIESQNVDGQGCCQGIACASSGVLAQVAMVMPIMLLIGRTGPNAEDHLYGRSIAPDTGPPKHLA